MDRLSEVLSTDLVPHNLLSIPGLTLPPGLEGIQQVHRMTLAAFPDLHVTSEDLFAEADRVVERWMQTQTHTGVAIFGALVGSGKPVRTTGISIYRIVNGKIVEHWAEMDFVSVLRQMGVLPSPGG